MGQLIHVIPKRTFTFDGRAGSTNAVVLEEGIDAAGFASGALVVRLHAKSGWTATASAEVLLQNMSRAAEEPHTLFSETGSRARATIPNGSAAGDLYVENIASPISGTLRVVLNWLQGGTAAGAGQTIAIGVDLVGRE